MSYLNRTASDDLGYKAHVYLSAEIAEYPGTLVSEKAVYAPKFIGFGIEAELHITAHTMATYTYGYSDPYWDITNGGVSILQIPGLECDLDIRIYPANEQELVDIGFIQGQDGKYSWAGLPESNLPRTKMEVTYDPTGSWVGEVNGTPFSNADNDGFRLTNGCTMDALYDSGGTGADGTYEASVKYKLGTDFRGSYEYLAECVTGGYNCYWLCQATGNSIYMTGAYLDRGGLTGATCGADINDYPLSYEYHITERSGLSLASCQFVDINGQSWTGATSDKYEYAGVQSIIADGHFSVTGHTETATPAFDAGNVWRLNDPAPTQFGGVSCTNAQVLNDYHITVTDEQDNETTYRPSRVQIYAPLGAGGDLEGDLSVTFTGSVCLESFGNPGQNWVLAGGTLSGGSITITDADNSLTGTGWERLSYDGEHGQLTADELIKHMPLCNRLTLSGVGFDANADVEMTISCGNKTYKYLPVSKSSTAYVYDLTMPDGFRGSDEQPKFITVHNVEWYTGNESDPAERYYIDEKPCEFPLYGATLFKNISFAGFSLGVMSLTSLVASYGEQDAYYQLTGEFKQVEQVGRQQIGGQDHPIYRNRHGIIAKSGRFLELVNNQKDVTPRGIETWRFPTISALEGSAGGRLIFPRDDWQSVSISASTRSASGSPAPVANYVSEQAYIGWIEAVNTLPKIKPLVDDIVANALFVNDFGEFECCIDIGGYWQGFLGENGTLALTNATGHTAAATDTVQYLTKGQTDGAWVYSVQGVPKRTGTMETPPGFAMRYCIRHLLIHGKILRNAVGKILRNAVGKILRGDFEE